VEDEMNKDEIIEKFQECFRNCAHGRIQLRKCVINSMHKGLTKDDVIAISDELVNQTKSDEASLCAITAIGQAIQYEFKHPKQEKITLSAEKREEVKRKLQECFKKCGLARRQLRKCVVNALNAGLSRQEILAITDELVGGMGKHQVSACAIVAVDQVLRYEETKRKTPIDIVKEREFERGDI
jgi:galactitol-specific phosphotransferase system IIB component